MLQTELGRGMSVKRRRRMPDHLLKVKEWVLVSCVVIFAGRDDFRAHEEAVQNRLRNQQF